MPGGLRTQDSGLGTRDSGLGWGSSVLGWALETAILLSKVELLSVES